MDALKPVGAASELLAELSLVDGHCHFVSREPLEAKAFELGATEADRPAPPGVSYLDSQLGFGIRRWCAPVLDLPAHSSTVDYLQRRDQLGAVEVLRRLVRAAGLAELLVDTGLAGDGLCSMAELSATGPKVREVVRLERVAEQVAAAGVPAAGFADAYRTALHAASEHAVAVKSIVAYRHGLDIDPARPAPREVETAAGAWLAAGGGRLTDPTLLRFVLWAGVDTRLPVQLHTGFGDADLALHRTDPALLQPWLAAVDSTGVQIVLLHCYPYHRQAGWLAQLYPGVHVDVGLTIGYVGAAARQVLGEFLELAPFGKLIFSTDAYLLPELYLVGAAQFRRALGELLDGWIAHFVMSTADALHVARLISGDSARRLYRLDN